MIRKKRNFKFALFGLVILLASLVLSTAVAAPPPALSAQDESILTIYVLFKANAVSEFTNNINDAATFRSLMRPIVAKIKEKRPEYFQSKISLQQVTTASGPKNIDINIPDVYDFILAKAKQFSDDALVEEYKKVVGPPKYQTDVKEFLLSVKVLVPAALNDILQGSGSLRVTAKYASDRGNSLLPFARRIANGANWDYVYEKKLKFDQSIEEDVAVTIENSYDFGYGLVDASNQPVEKVTTKFNRGAGPQEVALALQPRNNPIKTLRINLKYEQETGRTAMLSTLGYSLSDLPPVTIHTKDSATGSWTTFAEKRGAIIEVPLLVGKFYNVVYTRNFLQYMLDRVEDNFNNQPISATTVTDFQPVYELKGLIKPITIEQIAGNQIKVVMHKDDYTDVSLDTAGAYKTISTSTNDKKPAINILGGQSTVSGNDRTIILEVELAEGSYQLMLDDKYPLGQFTFLDTIKKTIDNEGDILYSPPPDKAMVRIVGEKFSLTMAKKGIQHNTLNGNLDELLVVRKDFGIITPAQYAKKGITVTQNGMDFTLKEAGEYKVQYEVGRSYSKTVKRGGMLFDWAIPDSTEEGVVTLNNVEWTITVVSDNKVEQTFIQAIDQIKTQAGNNYENAKKKRDLIQLKAVSDADTAAKRVELKTKAQTEIANAIKLLETDAVGLIEISKKQGLGESNIRLITEKSSVNGLLLLYKQEKTAIDALNTADNAVVYKQHIIDNLIFEPADAKTSNMLTIGRIELKLNSLPTGISSEADVFSTVDIKWEYKSKSPAAPNVIKEGTNTVFEFSPVPESVLDLKIREKDTTRREVIVDKSWHVEASIKPKIIVENLARQDGKNRINDEITLKVMPDSEQLTEAQYISLFDNYVFTIKNPADSPVSGSPFSETTNTKKFTLTEEGAYKVQAIVKSTVYTNYNDLPSDEILINVEKVSTPEGKRQGIDAAKKNAEEGKKLIDGSVAADGTVDSEKREKGEALIEKAIQDLKVINNIYDVELKATSTTDSQYTILQLNKESVEKEIKALENYLNAKFKSAPVEKTITTITTKQTITYYEGVGNDGKIYLKLEGSWNELPPGVSQELFINMYYLKKAKGIK